MAHPLALMLDRSADGVFPPADGVIELLEPLTGSANALMAWTGHFALTARLDPHEVADRAPSGDFSAPLSAGFLNWVATSLGTTSGPIDALFVRRALGPEAGVRSDDEQVSLEPVDDLDHARVSRANKYRSDVRVFTTESREGVVILGRGVTRRWELAYEVDSSAQGKGLGARLARAALRLLPEGTPLWAQVAPGHGASMRSIIAAGYRPVGAEVLFAHP